MQPWRRLSELPPGRCLSFPEEVRWKVVAALAALSSPIQRGWVQRKHRPSSRVAASARQPGTDFKLRGAPAPTGPQEPVPASVRRRPSASPQGWLRLLLQLLWRRQRLLLGDESASRRRDEAVAGPAEPNARALACVPLRGHLYILHILRHLPNNGEFICVCHRRARAGTVRCLFIFPKNSCLCCLL
jgi:hypothetical protein